MYFMHAQAVAAMAWGTASCPKVDKILGPGNQYVTAAKMLLQNSEAMVGGARGWAGLVYESCSVVDGRKLVKGLCDAIPL